MDNKCDAYNPITKTYKFHTEHKKSIQKEKEKEREKESIEVDFNSEIISDKISQVQ